MMYLRLCPVTSRKLRNDEVYIDDKDQLVCHCHMREVKSVKT